MSINVTGNQGTAHNVYAIGIHQGPLKVNQSRDEERLCDLRDQTRKDIANWTRGMVKVSAIETTIEKFQKGYRWVTVTGNAGDGKTTLGYMTLKHRQNEGKEVFKIDTPEDFFMISRRTPDCIVLMNDVFGAFDFDQRAFSTWLPLIQTILERQAKDTVNEAGPSVIFVSRLNVLEAARNQLGKYGDVVLGEDEIVNPGKLNSDGEKVEILNFHLARHNISDIPESTKKKLCSRSPHGFPHCCEMYVELRASDHAVDILKFFSSPLKFLNYTTQVLVDKQKYYDHFKILLKAGGQLDISRLRDATLRTEMQSTVSSLMGSYLKTSGIGVAFSHPSIYESVAVAVGNKDPLFAAQEFPISLIMQKCKMQLPRNSENHLNIFFKVSSSAMDALMQRLATEIRHGNYTVIQHELFSEKKICEKLMELSVRRSPSLFSNVGKRVGINQRDSSGHTMLHAAVKCSNFTAIEILLRRGANPYSPVIPDTQLTILHEIISTRQTHTLELFLQHGVDVDLATDHGVTLLHSAIKWLGSARAIDIVALLLKHGAKVNKADGTFWLRFGRKVLTFSGEYNPHEDDSRVSFGQTALHYACQSQYIDVNLIRLLINYGAHAGKVDDNGETALHYLCRREYRDDGIEITGLIRALLYESLSLVRTNQRDTVFKADNEDTLVDYLCQKYGIDEEELQRALRYNEAGYRRAETEETKAIIMLITRGAKVYQRNKHGQTAFHLLCQRSHVDVRTVHLMLVHGFPVDVADDDGNTALHYICQRRNLDITTLFLLIKYRVVDNTLENRRGRTALHYLCQRHNVILDRHSSVT
ncbi:uncharacterized protein [Haliotis cracherodii]|uniref:uncharacterized protein n=1 Tax=Haliotis cracherodii TaxID=6455 RepID=UPI0039EB47DF